MKKTSIYLLLTAALTFWATCALAGVSGSCANCHTMHATDGTGTAITGGAKGSLTIGGCVGCHTGNNAEVGKGAVDGAGGTPFVNYDTPLYGPEYVGGNLRATTNTLAGGSFYWVDKNGGNDKTKGHNVTTDGLSDWDMKAPGWVSNAKQTADFDGTTNTLTCSGTTGCHGNRGVEGDYASISGSHHGNGVAAGFRFLDGIGGTEDPDWEYTVAYDDHNGYKAEARTEDSVMGDGGNTISSLCGQCHGAFHSGTNKVSDGNSWLRHPTDIKLPAGEYAEYINSQSTGAKYNTVAPVGSVAASTGQIDLADSIVTCISCHRAHGSPYADLLRWDYVSDTEAGTMNTGGKTNNGCFACHTSKDKD